MTYVTFDRSFAAAHRVWRDPGKCQNIHGHNYEAELTVTVLDDWALDQSGFLVPFDAIKKVVDHYDHALILAHDDPLWGVLNDTAFDGLRIRPVPGSPSTEVLSYTIASEAADAILEANKAITTVRVVVGLREGAGIHATSEATATR